MANGRRAVRSSLLDVDFERKGDGRVVARGKRSGWDQRACYDHFEPVQWRDLSVVAEECVIACEVPRARRGDDAKVCRVVPPLNCLNQHSLSDS